MKTDTLTKRTKQLVATVALAGAVTAGTAGIAFAAEGSGPAPADPSAEGARHPRRALRHRVGGIVADTLGVSRADLRAALRGGQSIVGYAESLGQDPQAVIDALVNAAYERIDSAVTSGRITEERGAELKTKVPDRVNTLVNRQFGQAQAS